MRALLNQKTPVSNGAELANDVYMPDGPGPFPVIFIRTPYNKAGISPAPNSHVAMALDRGYAVVGQDVRGKFESTGSTDPLIYEVEDGAASLDWISNQSWCDGRIGMRGPSYLGIVQVPAAISQNQALKAIVPTINPGSYFRDWVRHDGCFALYNMMRWLIQNACSRTVPPINHFNWEQAWNCKTVDELEALVGMPVPFLRTVAEHDTNDEFWLSLDQTLMQPKVNIPAFHGGAWFDHISRNVIEGFVNIRTKSSNAFAREHQHLFMGPWGHLNYGASNDRHKTYGAWNFGDEAVTPIVSNELDFLDRYVREIDNGFDARPRVKLFVMGANRWHTTDSWPPEDAKTRVMHLSSNGDAAGPMAAGTLDQTAPTREAADTVNYDPKNPRPTLGGPVYWGVENQWENTIGPQNQVQMFKSSDVRYYRSEPLEKPMTICGSVTLDLHLQADVEDTDVIVKLCVDEEDRVDVITLGSLRLRYREGFDRYTPLPKNTPVSVTLELLPTCYQFAAKSRVGLIITHSDWPRIEAHPNVIAPPLSGAAPVVAEISVLHGPSHASKLNLPVVPW